MSVTRESTFLCTFRTPRGDGSAWVRAWNPQQALETVRAQLREAGFANVVDLRVAQPPRPAPAQS
jgi:hypothetical protein